MGPRERVRSLADLEFDSWRETMPQLLHERKAARRCQYVDRARCSRAATREGWLWDDPDLSLLSWLQARYTANCDGNWEHQYGVRIETLDNPGWSIEVELNDTPLDGIDYPRTEMSRDHTNWILVQVEDNTWRFFGGPLNLTEGLHLFRDWVRATTQPDRTWGLF